MKNGKKFILTICTLAFLATCGFYLQASAAKKGIDKGDSFPKINLGYLGKSKKFEADKLKGKVVIVDFWASWCEPCKVELPFLNGLYAKYKKKGLVVVGINVDDEQGSAQKFLKDHPVKFPIVYDDGKKMIETVKTSTMPTSFIVDRKGKVQFIHRGFHEESKAKFEKQIQSLLK